MLKCLTKVWFVHCGLGHWSKVKTGQESWPKPSKFEVRIDQFILFPTKKARNHRCDEKIIVITGANCGIGFETAKEVLERGARVIILCRNKVG